MGCETVANTDQNLDLPPARPDGVQTRQQIRAVSSADLLQGKREMLIIHGNQTYRLLRTRNDKLILQK